LISLRLPVSGTIRGGGYKIGSLGKDSPTATIERLSEPIYVCWLGRNQVGYDPDPVPLDQSRGAGCEEGE